MKDIHKYCEDQFNETEYAYKILKESPYYHSETCVNKNIHNEIEKSFKEYVEFNNSNTKVLDFKKIWCLSRLCSLFECLCYGIAFSYFDPDADSEKISKELIPLEKIELKMKKERDDANKKVEDFNDKELTKERKEKEEDARISWEPFKERINKLEDYIKFLKKNDQFNDECTEKENKDEIINSINKLEQERILEKPYKDNYYEILNQNDLKKAEFNKSYLFDIHYEFFKEVYRIHNYFYSLKNYQWHKKEKNVGLNVDLLYLVENYNWFFNCKYRIPLGNGINYKL